MEKDLISISEAAKILGVSIMTLRRWDASGRLSSVRKSPHSHRYYRKEDIEFFRNDLFQVARDWVATGKNFPEELYCQNSAIFQARLVKMENALMRDLKTRDIFSLIVSVAGEIGNNSFDHNLGQWQDTPGIFFGYDLNKKQIVLADRGLGILETLKRARPGLKNHSEALRVAFTEIISGRAPENRGNGLKYVRKIISKNPVSLVFQTGNAQLNLSGGNPDLQIKEITDGFRGCLALITF
ncbi:MAG: helix-turn-helix domain-containing protein [Candidatus Moranbacteria bacterium]|nr:helix-turn-helix domain-containing protein [Candidatus Moranbacteria bacterium]